MVDHTNYTNMGNGGETDRFLENGRPQKTEGRYKKYAKRNAAMSGLTMEQFDARMRQMDYYGGGTKSDGSTALCGGWCDGLTTAGEAGGQTQMFRGLVFIIFAMIACQFISFGVEEVKNEPFHDNIYVQHIFMIIAVCAAGLLALFKLYNVYYSTWRSPVLKLCVLLAVACWVVGGSLWYNYVELKGSESDEETARRTAWFFLGAGAVLTMFTAPWSVTLWESIY